MNILAALAADPNVSPAFRAAISPICPERATYKVALRKHDWSHEFSDDGNAYRKGKAELVALREQQQRIDRDWKIWNSIAPAQCANGGSYS